MYISDVVVEVWVVAVNRDKIDGEILRHELLLYTQLYAPAQGLGLDSNNKKPVDWFHRCVHLPTSDFLHRVQTGVRYRDIQESITRHRLVFGQWASDHHYFTQESISRYHLQ